MIWTRFTVVGSLVVSGQGCSQSNLNISNQSPETIFNVTIKSNEEEIIIGDIYSGKSKAFSRSISGEGGLSVFYTYRNQRLTFDGCYYTGGMPADGLIVIRGNSITRRCD